MPERASAVVGQRMCQQFDRKPIGRAQTSHHLLALTLRYLPYAYVLGTSTCV